MLDVMSEQREVVGMCPYCDGVLVVDYHRYPITPGPVHCESCRRIFNPDGSVIEEPKS